MADSPSQTCPRCVLPTGSNSSGTAPVQVPSTGGSPLGTDCSSMHPWGSHRSWPEDLLLPRPFQWPAGGYLPHHGLPWAREDNLQLHSLHQGHQQRLQENLCSIPWSTSSSSFFSDRVVCRVSFTYSHFSLSAAVVQGFLLFPKCVTAELLLPSAMGSALTRAGSVLEQTTTCCVLHGAGSGAFSQKPPLHPSAAKPSPHKPKPDNKTVLLLLLTRCYVVM